MKIERKELIKRGLTNASVQYMFLVGIVLALPASGFGAEAQGGRGAPPGETSQKQESAAQSGQAESAPVPMMEQRALDRLKQMSETLRAAKAFTVRTRSTVEVPAKTGQNVTLFGTSDVALERPNKLRVKVTGEVPNFEFFYDGTYMAAVAAHNNVYSKDRAPGTIDGLLDVVEEKSGIHFATADVMFSDPYAMLTKDLTSAFVVGAATVDGSPCEHLAFKGRGVHWEVWVETGEKALPRYLAVTYAQVENFPRFLVEFSNWNLQPKLAADFAVFKPPPNAKQIDFRPLAPTPTGRK
jgi:hypothetical protein